VITGTFESRHIEGGSVQRGQWRVVRGSERESGLRPLLPYAGIWTVPTEPWISGGNLSVTRRNRGIGRPEGSHD
jgi:hypothetical protein